jgi:hypothetical protein
LLGFGEMEKGKAGVVLGKDCLETCLFCGQKTRAGGDYIMN